MRGNQLVRIRYGCSEPPHPHTPQRLCRNPPQAGRQQTAVPLTPRRFPVRRGTGSTPSVLQAADGVGCRWLARRPACAAPRILTHTLPSNSPLVATAPLLCRWPLAHDETDDGDDDEYDKQHISDGGCCTRYFRNPQEGAISPTMRIIMAQCSMIGPPWIGIGRRKSEVTLTRLLGLIRHASPTRPPL